MAGLLCGRSPWMNNWPVAWDFETDIVVVGYGGAGAAAAIEGRAAGAEVIIIEKAPIGGGTTAMAGGIIVGAGTSVQRARQIADSPEEMYRYFRATGKGLDDPDLARVYCESSTSSIEWLISLGMQFQNLLLSGSENYPEYAAVTPPKPRGHLAPGGGAFFQVLKNACEQRGVQVNYKTRLKELVTDSQGAVCGVKAESGEKTLYFKARKAVVLACGGYGYHREMLKQYSFDKGYQAVYTGSLNSTGDGIRAAQMLGADLVCMGQIGAIPAVQRPGQKIARIAYYPKNPDRHCSLIAVNQKGRRFTDESGFYNYIAYDMLRPGNLPNYVIFDARARTTGTLVWPPWSGREDQDIADGTTHKAGSIRELAEKIGLNPDTLHATVTNYNNNAEKGQDPEFGRTLYLFPLNTPPFYAFERIVGITSTLGGLKINTSAQVVNVKGEVIPRLYAGGETAGGAIGLNYPASGTALQNAIGFGRIAGQQAAAETAWE
jgi:flavocytochrome c